MQQKLSCLDSRVAVKPLLHDFVREKVRNRKQAHALVMSHPAADQFVVMAPGAMARG
jgi:hypothetical protein